MDDLQKFLDSLGTWARNILAAFGLLAALFVLGYFTASVPDATQRTPAQIRCDLASNK